MAGALAPASLPPRASCRPGLPGPPPLLAEGFETQSLGLPPPRLPVFQAIHPNLQPLLYPRSGTPCPQPNGTASFFLSNVPCLTRTEACPRLGSRPRDPAPVADTQVLPASSRAPSPPHRHIFVDALERIICSGRRGPQPEPSPVTRGRSLRGELLGLSGPRSLRAVGSEHRRGVGDSLAERRRSWWVREKREAGASEVGEEGSPRSRGDAV